MATILFHEIVFGPVHSRRLGISLGINLLPRNGKLCNFDCLYCECGYNRNGKADRQLPSRQEVANALEEKLQQMAAQGELPDVITFAGNGEPTLHPDFQPIINDTILLRDHYCPNADICVLSNASLIARPDVRIALERIDRNILKLDSACTPTLHRLNVPGNPTLIAEEVIENLKSYAGEFILQTLFCKGTHQGETIDNTTPEEVEAWLKAIEETRPKSVMLYTIDRETPEKSLQKASRKTLEAIAARVEALGIPTSISC